MFRGFHLPKITAASAIKPWPEIAVWVNWEIIASVTEAPPNPARTPETITYYDSKNPNFLKLKETGVEIGILSDALFTLFPVMYFSEECYKKLIKVPKEELLKRLEGKAKKVLLLEKGIYIIFNDKADISYEEFVEMNETFKPLLGLI